MRKQLILSSTVEETRNELTDDDLFDLFKKKVGLLNPGEKFFFQRSNEHFSAKTDGVDISPDLNQSEPDLGQNLNEFLNKNLKSQNSSIETRAYQCLKIFAEPKTTVKDLLENQGHIRNYGKKAHDWTRSQFERLGFKVNEYPFFQRKF